MAVFPPRVAYYIVVLDPAGQPFSYAGSPTEPIVVPVVTTRTREPPHLPGRPPPRSCGRCDLLDHAEGRCGGPSVCRDQICGWDEHTSCPADCTPSSRTPPVLPSLWIAAGVGVGAAVARDETVVNPDAGAGASCADGAPAEECVDVTAGTALVPPAAHLAGGYFVKDWLSVDAALRWAIVAEDRSSVDGDFLRWEIEAHLGLWSRRSVSSDLWFHFFAGLGYGSIQPEIAAEARDGSQVTIFETSGPASASVGGGILWHLGDPGGLALVAEYDAYYFFPATLPGIELWVGAAYGLGGP